jgi:2-dehydropantoate 2-reductase
MLGGATGALLAWPPARVFADRRLFGVELASWREAVAVMRALGHRPVALPGYPVDRFAALARLPEGLLFRVAAGRLGAARGDRLPGPAADLAAGRPDTEIRQLHGAVAAAGTGAGVPTPVCAALASLVAEVASGRRERSSFAGRPEALLAAVREGPAPISPWPSAPASSAPSSESPSRS